MTTDDTLVQIQEQLNDISAAIAASPDLSSNATVNTAMSNVQSQPTSSFAQSSQVISSLKGALPVFTNPASSPEDIASSALGLTSSILYAASAIPGAAVVTAPLGFLVGLIGAIVGVFGGKKKDNMLDEITKIVDDAANKQTSQEMWQQLQGGYGELRDKFIDLSAILSVNSTISSQFQAQNANYTIDNFNAEQSDLIGAAIQNLKDNVGTDCKDNWANTATTYFLLSQVLTLKIMYISQGIAYFNACEGEPVGSPQSRASMMTQAAIAIFQNYYNDSKIFFDKPDLAHAGITNQIYRLSQSQFALIGALYVSQGSTFFPSPGTQYRITDTVSLGVDNGQTCTRLTTLRELQASPERVLHGNMAFSSANIYTEKTHFAVWAAPNHYPFYRWYFLPKENVDNLDNQETYIFEINPSTDERNQHGIDPGDHTLLIIGNTSENTVWASAGKIDDDDKMTPAAYDQFLADNPHPKNCLWVWLSENG